MSYSPYGGYTPYYMPDQRQGPYQAAMMPQNGMMGPMSNQPMMQQNAQQNAPQQPQGGVIWVHDEQQAQGYPIAPNSSAVLWVETAPVIYLKQADASGRPITQAYDLVERQAAPVAAQNAQRADFANYVTKDELKELSDRVDALASRRGRREAPKEADE